MWSCIMIWLWHHQNDAAPVPFRTAPTNLYYKHIEYTTDFKKEHDIKQFSMSFFGSSRSRINSFNCTRSRINCYPDPENKYDTVPLCWMSEYRTFRHPVSPVPDWKKLTMPEPVRYRNKVMQSGTGPVRYRTEVTDAGMPMPALVF
jgi:hypothetical protein